MFVNSSPNKLLCYKTNMVPITPFMLHSPGRRPPRRALPSCASRRCPRSCPGAPGIHVFIYKYIHTYIYICMCNSSSKV